MEQESVLSRFKKGVEMITPMQTTKINLIGNILVVIGVLIGLYATFGTWWLFIILIGSLLLTGMALLGVLKTYFMLRKIEEIKSGGILNE